MAVNVAVDAGNVRVADSVGTMAVGGGGGAPQREGWHATNDRIVTVYRPKFFILRWALRFWAE